MLPFLYKPGPSASERLQKFVEAIEPLASPTTEARDLREEAFDNADKNENDLLSLTEVEMFVSELLRKKYGDLTGRSIFLAYVKSTRRAFAAAKSVDPKHSTEVLEGNVPATQDDFVSFSEFRILCAYLCAFAGMQDAFKSIDAGAPTPANGNGAISGERDRKITLDEWMAHYKLVANHGFKALSGIESDEQAKKMFSEIDADGSGIIAFPEWCDYIEKTEVKLSTEVGQLLAIQFLDKERKAKVMEKTKAQEEESKGDEAEASQTRSISLSVKDSEVPSKDPGSVQEAQLDSNKKAEQLESQPRSLDLTKTSTDNAVQSPQNQEDAFKKMASALPISPYFESIKNLVTAIQNCGMTEYNEEEVSGKGTMEDKVGSNSDNVRSRGLNLPAESKGELATLAASALRAAEQKEQETKYERAAALRAAAQEVLSVADDVALSKEEQLDSFVQSLVDSGAVANAETLNVARLAGAALAAGGKRNEESLRQRAAALLAAAESVEGGGEDPFKQNTDGAAGAANEASGTTGINARAVSVGGVAVPQGNTADNAFAKPDTIATLPPDYICSPPDHLYKPGPSASDQLQKFVDAIEPLARLSSNAKELREVIFRSSDLSHNDLLSLSEVEMFVSDRLRKEYGMQDGRCIFLAYVKSTRRAFAAAKGVDPRLSTEVLEGTRASTRDDFVSFSEFRILCAYLCAYAGMQDAFKVIDAGVPSSAEEEGINALGKRDRIITREEWMAHYKLVGKHGFETLSGIENDEQAKKIFDEINTDGSGVFAINHLFDYIERKEVESSTEVGRLLALQFSRRKVNRSSSQQNGVPPIKYEWLETVSKHFDEAEAALSKEGAERSQSTAQALSEAQKKHENALKEKAAILLNIAETLRSMARTLKGSEAKTFGAADDLSASATTVLAVSGQEEALKKKAAVLLDAARQTQAEAGKEKSKQLEDLARSLLDLGTVATNDALEFVRLADAYASEADKQYQKALNDNPAPSKAKLDEQKSSSAEEKVTEKPAQTEVLSRSLNLEEDPLPVQTQKSSSDSEETSSKGETKQTEPNNESSSKSSTSAEDAAKGILEAGSLASGAVKAEQDETKIESSTETRSNKQSTEEAAASELSSKAISSLDKSNDEKSEGKSDTSKVQSKVSEKKVTTKRGVTKGSTKGGSASELLHKFVAAMEPLTIKTKLAREHREAVFESADGNNNGLLSLAEVETFVSDTLRKKYGVQDGRRIFLGLTRSIHRAFFAAKSVDPIHSKDVLEGTNSATKDDYVSFSEFRLLCAYMCIFARMQNAFSTVDVGAPDPSDRTPGKSRRVSVGENDRRISTDEWLANYKLVAGHGFQALSGIGNDNRAKQIFHEIDRDGSGFIGVNEWCDYIERKEVEASTDMGQLLAFQNTHTGSKACSSTVQKDSTEHPKARSIQVSTGENDAATQITKGGAVANAKEVSSIKKPAEDPAKIKATDNAGKSKGEEVLSTSRSLDASTKVSEKSDSCNEQLEEEIKVTPASTKTPAQEEECQQTDKTEAKDANAKKGDITKKHIPEEAQVPLESSENAPVEKIPLGKGLAEERQKTEKTSKTVDSEEAEIVVKPVAPKAQVPDKEPEDSKTSASLKNEAVDSEHKRRNKREKSKSEGGKSNKKEVEIAVTPVSTAPQGVTTRGIDVSSKPQDHVNVTSRGISPMSTKKSDVEDGSTGKTANVSNDQDAAQNAQSVHKEAAEKSKETVPRTLSYAQALKGKNASGNRAVPTKDKKIEVPSQEKSTDGKEKETASIGSSEKSLADDMAKSEKAKSSEQSKTEDSKQEKSDAVTKASPNESAKPKIAKKVGRIDPLKRSLDKNGVAPSHLYKPGTSAMLLQKFVKAIEPLALPTAEARELREEAFTKADRNNNEFLSLGEVEMFISDILREKYGVEDGRKVFLAYVKSSRRAFSATKAVDSKHFTEVLEGSRLVFKDKLISFSEFGILCAYLCAYAGMHDAFKVIDVGAPSASDGGGGDVGDRDRKISFEEWMTHYKLVANHGLNALSNINDDVRAKQMFSEIDADASGVIALSEWCDYIERKEVDSSTEVGRLLALRHLTA